MTFARAIFASRLSARLLPPISAATLSCGEASFGPVAGDPVLTVTIVLGTGAVASSQQI